MKIKLFKIHILNLIFISLSLYGLSQDKLYVIDTPKIINPYKQFDRILFIFEKDKNIGKFTTDFIDNLTNHFESKGMQSIKAFKTPKDSKRKDKRKKFPKKVDSALNYFNPNGLIFLRFIDGGITTKFEIGDCPRSFFRFQFEYTYRINDEEPFIQMYMTRLIVDQENIDNLGLIVSDAIIEELRRKKIIK